MEFHRSTPWLSRKICSQARLKRSEQLRQQLQGSFTQVLHRLDSTERKESKLHQAGMGGWGDLSPSYGQF